MYVDDLSKSWENQVGRPRHRPHMEPVAIAQLVRHSPHNEFRRRVARLHGRHDAGSLAFGKGVRHASFPRFLATKTAFRFWEQVSNLIIVESRLQTLSQGD